MYDLQTVSSRPGTSGSVGGDETQITEFDLEQQQQDFYRKSAEEHREFLLQTLQQVKEQLQQPSALLESTDTAAAAGK